ncbi:MAG: M23 family metallopeptidase [Bacilli bacterium]|nr:M23 family metallopeptidase [Bacilli bacterium]
MRIRKWLINIFLLCITILVFYMYLSYDNRDFNRLLKNNDKMEFVINEVDMADKEVVKTTATPISNNVSVPINKWVLPIEGNYVITTYYSFSHKAVDFYSYNGYDSKIKAANSGEVISVNGGCDFAGSSCNGGRGNFVVIKHYVDNYYTVYMHLHNIYVRVGSKVNSGDAIASMGNTGYVIPARSPSNPYGGTHLHFCLFKGEPYKGGYAINPMDLY